MPEWFGELIKQGGFAALAGAAILLCLKLLKENMALTRLLIEQSRSDVKSDEQVKSSLDRLSELLKVLIEQIAQMKQSLERLGESIKSLVDADRRGRR